jgi:hypothetical protein
MTTCYVGHQTSADAAPTVSHPRTRQAWHGAGSFSFIWLVFLVDISKRALGGGQSTKGPRTQPQRQAGAEAQLLSFRNGLAI